MCGFFGEIDLQKPLPQGNRDIYENILASLAPRGPDDTGLLVKKNLAFGHRRLMVMEESNCSEQPMIDQALGLTLVFNGAIYNHYELRGELEKQGYKFGSHGDTEVILKAYHFWGSDCVQHFNGMFAFAIFDRRKNEIFLARDRMGIKPLYYVDEGQGYLRFASTLPALLKWPDISREIDPEALAFYLHLHAVVPAPYTMLKCVRKLPPASWMRIRADGTSTLTRYWQPRYEQAQKRELSESEWEDTIFQALRTSVSRRLVADVPVGVLLSGGLDSSLIVALLAENGCDMSKIQTFSIGFDTAGNEAGDEFYYSDIVANHFGTEHHQIFVDGERVIANLRHAIDAMSEPMVSHDNIGFYLLSEKVSQHIKVVMSGQGADEVFAGYHWYPAMEQASDPFETYRKSFFDRDEEEYRQVVCEEYYRPGKVDRFVAEYFAERSGHAPADLALDIDSHIMLVDDPVKRVDNMTMAFGLEARVPFLDHELIELAAQMPAKYKLAQEGKGILKQIARKILPAAVIDRPKGYFPVPALKYLQGPYLNMVQEHLSQENVQKRGLFRYDYIEKLCAAPENHITPLRGSKLWQAFLLEKWLDQHGVG